MADLKAETPEPPILADASVGDDPFDIGYPRKLREQEYRHVNKRRNPQSASAQEPDHLVGFGLSGGGIRSATFSLGLFQGLAEQGGLLSRIDFLSTVSGGGYFGAFLGRLFSRDYIQGTKDVEEVLKSTRKPRVLGFLRENGRYLSPNGAGDQLLAGASLLRNWVSIHLVLIVFWLTSFLALQMLRIGVRQIPWFVHDDQLLVFGRFYASPYLLLPILIFVIAVFPLGWAFWLIRPERQVLKAAAARARAGQEEEKRKAEGAAGSIGPASPPDSSKDTADPSAITPWSGLVLVLTLALCLLHTTWGEKVNRAALLLTVVALATVGWRLAVWVRIRALRRQSRETDDAEDKDQKPLDWELHVNRWIPNRLGLWLTSALTVSGVLLALALIDSLGQSLYILTFTKSISWKGLAGFFGGVMTAGGYASRIAANFSKGPAGSRPKLPLAWIATAAALLLAFVVLVGINALSYGFVWAFQLPGQTPSTTLLGIALLAGLFLSLLFGQTWSFVNSSSYQSQYSARLTRAYLGASNEKRWSDHSVTEAMEGDDEDLARYWPPPSHKGAPIHLINVTINETIDGRSQIQQQDRKGVGMALGPCGMSAGVRHHLLLPFGEDRNVDPAGARVEVYPEAKTDFRIFDYPRSALNGKDRVFTGEMLPLGSWVGISGAAFSTGTGMRTSLGLSLLAGMGNVRLGRWWDSGVVRPSADGKRGPRLEALLARVFPVQTYILNEFLARFPGTARQHWYLSDGGHFENMGGYELIRRRARLIVIVDGEQDQDYTFEGLANLVRKARLDFGAEIAFLSETQLDATVDDSVRSVFGTLDQLRRGRWEETSVPGSKGRHGKLLEIDPAGRSLAHAALARITYSPSNGPQDGWLLYIKPTLVGDEPADLVEYHRNHPNFPHEPTLDQFFDEAQWESYRKLGQHIAEKLFASPQATAVPSRWYPVKAMEGRS
ncbi:MAG TPA: hypothetical protein VIJ36_09645 [Thermoanaerobaculia bacterium]